MTCQRKPRVAVVAICGRRLKHPVEARVTHGRNCGYCLGKRSNLRVMYSWGHRGIGKVQLAYGAACEDCATIEGE